MKQRNKAQNPSAALLLWAGLNLQEFLQETCMVGFPAFQPLHPCSPPPSPAISHSLDKITSKCSFISFRFQWAEGGAFGLWIAAFILTGLFLGVRGPTVSLDYQAQGPPGHLVFLTLWWSSSSHRPRPPLSHQSLSLQMYLDLLHKWEALGHCTLALLLPNCDIIFAPCFCF